MLRFEGILAWWQGLGLAVLFAGLAWWLYRREFRAHPAAHPRLAHWLPALRALAVFLFFLILTGPVLHWRWSLARKATVMVFVDGSQSMAVDDQQLDPGRKLALMHQLGLVPKDAVDLSLMRAGEHLARAAHAATAGTRSGLSPDELAAAQHAVTEAVAAAGQQAAGSARLSAQQKQQMQGDLGDPAAALAATAGDPSRRRGSLQALLPAIARWQQQIAAAFDRYARDLLASDQAGIRGGLVKLDNLNRWQRIEAALLKTEDALLPRLARKHHVELWVLHERQAQRLWWSDQKTALPDRLELGPTGRFTNLTRGLSLQAPLPEAAAVPGPADTGRTAFVLISDGQSNDGPSPGPLAEQWGQRGLPLFTVGVGSTHLPPDLAVMQIKAPKSVLTRDRVKGHVQIKDDMPPGQAFALKIEHNGKVVFQKALTTDQSHLRTIEYDFAVEDLVAGASGVDGDVVHSGIPLSLKVHLTPLEGEKDKANNQDTLLVRAITGRRKVLLVDGRPRWEFRYLRNAFDRDPEWDTRSLLAGSGAAKGRWPRGNAPDAFPASLEELYAFDLVILGEIPPGWLAEKELEWLRTFVQTRGGGLVCIDGQRGHLRTLAAGALGSLLPVQWQGGGTGPQATEWRLTQAGALQGAFNLAADRADSRQLWASLQPPHWVASVRALPGAEVYLEAVTPAATVPAVAGWTVGAGKVLYAGVDETWRLRYDVADAYHVRYWGQLAAWVMEKPFAVRDRYVMLDVGQTHYEPGQQVEIRVRLRDAAGKPLVRASAQAVLSREGKPAAALALVPDGNEGGLYTATTSSLEPGQYEVAVRVQGLPPAEMKVRLPFAVGRKDAGAGETALLTCDEDLLRRLAAASGGDYFREESLRSLADRLEPWSREKTLEKDLSLWDNWHAFVPIILLLTIEWIIRKRAGLI